LELVVEFDAGVAGSSEDVWEERWQRFKHGILQAGNEKHGHKRLKRGEASRTHAFWLMVVSPMMCYDEPGRGLEGSRSIGSGKWGGVEPAEMVVVDESVRAAPNVGKEGIDPNQ
jgi:hypothetical protein